MDTRTGPTGVPVVLAGVIGITRGRVVIARADRDEVLADVPGPGAVPGTGPEQQLDLLLETIVRAREQVRDGDGAAPRPVAAELAVRGLLPEDRDRATAIARDLLAPLGVPPRAVGVGDDVLTSFLAGGVGDDGVLLRAGSGSVGVRLEGRRAVARRDGMGWLLGDIGSAVWIGRRTLQLVAADLDGRGRRTALTERVGAELGLDLRGPATGGRDPRDALVGAVGRLAPPGRHAELGRFAPLPGTVPADPVAREVLDQVTRHFAATVRALDPSTELPVVLAGPVLATPGPIHDELVTGWDAEGRPHREAPSGIPGALLLAREAARGSRGSVGDDGRDLPGD